MTIVCWSLSFIAQIRTARRASFAVVAFLAASPGLSWGASSADVTLKDSGSEITVGNGLAQAVINKAKASVTALTLCGVHNLVSRGGITFDAEAFGKGKNEAGLAGGDGIVVSNSPDLVEVKFVDPNFIHFLHAEMHIVMKRGVPGIYEYLVLKHGEGQPAGSVGQLRWVFRGDSNLLNHAYGSASKQGLMISNQALQGSRLIADATFRLNGRRAKTLYPEPTGLTSDGVPVYSKYDWTDYVENHCVHGFSSDTEGIFMVQPSLEYYNGGPTKGILTVHNGPVCILEFLGGHFLIRKNISIHLEANQQWQQIIGPWLAYVNKGSDPKTLWQDAAARGQTEKKLWPYDWVKEDEALYPHHRGTITGTLALPQQKAANALVVLASSDQDWQTQTMGYEFWTRADADGHFVIPKVRPGSYALYASVPHVVGEVKVPGINATAGTTRDLGTIQWNPPLREQLLWQVGTPDRSAAEFRFGDEPRQFGLWWRYQKEMGTRDLNFTVGKSVPAKDWYYAQSVIPQPDGSYFSPTWNIDFDLSTLPSRGPMLLTIDLAGAVGDKSLHVSVNDHAIGDIPCPNDSGIYRSAVRSAEFRHNTLQFDPSLLRAGTNRISFKIDAEGTWSKNGADSIITTDTSAMPEIPSAGVMYDCIQLEAGVVTGDGSYKLIPSN